MEQAKKTVLADGTELDVDPARPYSRFMRLVKGAMTIRFTHAEAAAIYTMLHEYFAQPEVQAAAEGRGVVLARLGKVQEKVDVKDRTLGTELESIIHALRGVA